MMCATTDIFDDGDGRGLCIVEWGIMKINKLYACAFKTEGMITVELTWVSVAYPPVVVVNVTPQPQCC